MTLKPDIDWQALCALREQFLESGPSPASYWKSMELLKDYDLSFGRRIGWKWGAVLGELLRSGWSCKLRRVVDWGCGTGVASRSLVEHWGRWPEREWLLYDRSENATRFARQALKKTLPKADIRILDETELLDTCRGSLLLISHVQDELDEEGRSRLLACIRRADAVIWIEPGTRESAAGLVAMREQLRERFQVMAPCTHQGPCGMLEESRLRDWCHHFATPPPEVFTTGFWARFHKETGIDLHRLPYAFLVLERRQAGGSTASTTTWTRTIGRPRMYKGHAKILLCDGDGLREEAFMKRFDRDLFRALKEPAPPRLVRWERKDDRLVGGLRIEDQHA